MIKVLILTSESDIHAAAVHKAMSALGHGSTVLYSPYMPLHTPLSVFLENENEESREKFFWSIERTDEDDIKPGFDAVWNRRIVTPDLYTEVANFKLHHEDYEFARIQNKYCQNGFFECAEDRAFWVNGLEASRKSSSKIKQMKLAMSLGLQIPATLVSNNPIEIRNFIKKYGDHEVIYKPFYPKRWSEEDGTAAYLPTTAIAESDLPDDQTLQLTPGIFQKRIPKAYEVRATFFGAYCVAVRMDTQSVPGQELDWRFNDVYEFEMDRIEIPQKIYETSIEIMKKFGLVFGCFDYIVQPDGKYIFLEVNERGQFLWIERYTEIPMLDIFCEFIASGKFDFHYHKNSCPDVRFLDVYAGLKAEAKKV